MLGLSETMGRLAVANCICWHCNVLRRKDGHVLRQALDFELKVKGRKECRRGHERSWLKNKI